MTTEIVEKLTPEQLALKTEVIALGTIQVVDAETYEAAGRRCKELVAMEKRIGVLFDPPVKRNMEALDASRALRAIFLDPVLAAKKAQPVSMKTWEREEERKRQEAERVAQEAAKKQAEEDALALAESLEKQGTPEAKAEATSIIETPVAVPQVIIPTSKPSGFGSFTRENWKAEVTDIKALARAVLVGQVPELALMGNSVFIGQQVRSMKGMMKWPGVRTWPE